MVKLVVMLWIALATAPGGEWWRVYGARIIQPAPRWAQVADAVERCTGLDVDLGAIQWFIADSIVDLNAPSRLTAYADGLHVRRSASAQMIYLLNPSDLSVVRHELLHAAGLDHNDNWFTECVR